MLSRALAAEAARLSVPEFSCVATLARSQVTASMSCTVDHSARLHDERKAWAF